MTTIAFDGKILAADSAMAWGELFLPAAASKIMTDQKILIALAGKVTDGRALARWLMAGETKDDFPRGIDDDVVLFAHDRKNGSRFVGANGHSECVAAPYANGGGCEVAMGAMMAGANAVEAVRIACKLQVRSRGPIDYVIVGAEEWIIRQAPAPATRDTVEVRPDGDVPAAVRLGNGSANGGSAPHPQHEGHT